MLLISNIGIRIVKDATIDHVKRMTLFCQQSSNHIFVFFAHVIVCPSKICDAWVFCVAYYTKL